MGISNTRCSECTGKRQVFPVGPKNARIALIGEGPGKNEDKDGIPFIGVSGREQDHTYFGRAGIDRRDVFITNCIQCRMERGGVDVRPGPSLVSACVENHLREELCQVEPEIIILAGATASSLFGIDLEMEHGFPTWCGDLLGTGLGAHLVAMYHPAAGLRETRYMIPLLQDWERLGKWLRGEWEPPKITDYKPDYRLIEHPDDVWDAMVDDPRYEIAIDTESDDGRLYSIQFSTRPGYARMILTSNKKAVENFATALAWNFNEPIMHNAVYDLAELSTLGLHIPRFRDTMQELYHLGGILPQGLKAAVYRIFGFRMTSYDEVVMPASRALLVDWLAEALDFSNQAMAESILHRSGKGCQACGKSHRLDRTERKPHPSEAVLRRILNKTMEGTTYDPWKPPTYAKGELKLRLAGREWLEYIEKRVGRMPRPSIVHAPIERQIQYACGDADWTGRLATWLEGERSRIIQEEWRVA